MRARSASVSRPSDAVAIKPLHILVAGYALLAALAVLLGVRRISGTLLPPDSPLICTSAATVLIAWIYGLRRLTLLVPIARRSRLALFCLSSGCAVLAGAAMTWASNRPAETTLLWSVIAAGEAVGWLLWQRATPATAVQEVATLDRESEEEGEEDAGVASDDECVEQQLVRRRFPDGGERLDGRLRATFTVGQRTAWLHISFCPPLGNAPMVIAAQVAGPPARVRVVQTLIVGAKIEVRLDATTVEPAAVEVEFAATSGDSQAAAAPSTVPAGRG